MSLNNPQSVRHAEPQPPPIFNFAPTETQYDRGFFGQAQNNAPPPLPEASSAQGAGSQNSAGMPLISPAQHPAPPGNDGDMVFNSLPRAELANNFQQLQQNSSKDSLPKPEDSWANQLPPAAPENDFQGSEVPAKQSKKAHPLPNIVQPY